MVKRCEKLDSIVEGLCCDVLSLVRIKKKISSLKDPNDVIYVGNELWKNIFEKGLKRTPEVISFLRDMIYKANEKTRKLSTRDYLTGLLNRRFLDSELKKQLASTYRNSHNFFSVIMFDIDNFKFFNDVYGHNAGDVVLKALGGIVSKSVRGSDVAFRYGGEEFLVLLPNTSKTDALDVAYRLNRQVANTKVTFVDERGMEHKKPVSVSVGVVEINQESPIWLLYRVGGKQLVVNYVNNGSDFDKILDYFRRYFVSHFSVRGAKLTKKDIKKDVKKMGDFVKSYIAKNNLDVHDVSVAKCARCWIVEGVDNLVYYVKKHGKNGVAYINGDGAKILERSK